MAALSALTEVTAEHALALARGKVGLALSGGGFRASLYHLGVLARLAEMDVLRHVEALSTVSGGSIVGAHYYLKLLKMLESSPDKALEAKDYVKLVDELSAEFMEGVRTNLRMQTLSSLPSNFRMMFDRSYTRSTRLGDLYDRYFYRREGRLAGGRGPVSMNELLVTPNGTPPGTSFNPKFSNWRRNNKVPVLLLNATPLNTGHGWHFTARSMGEPPGLARNEIDCKPRYRRLYYSQAPTEDLQRFRLGHAAAASAGVPGLFEPIVLAGLYPDRTVRLVDGGVHDNQGVEALLNEGCNFILCSDASGQMGEEREPPSSTIGVLTRTNSVMMDRVRDAEYLDLDARKQSRSLTGLVFLHLKKDIGAEKLDWIRCQDPSPVTTPRQLLPYGINRDIQGKLADLRTDLDSFTDEEAAALMASGYLMAQQEFELLDELEGNGTGQWGGFDIKAPQGDWPFLQPEFLNLLAARPDATPERTALGKRLKTGSGLFFKVLRVDPWSWVIAIALLAAVVAGVWFVAADWLTDWFEREVRIRDLALAALLALLVLVVPVLGWLRPDNIVRKWVVRLAFAVLGWIACNAYLLLFNKRFLASGRLKGFYDTRDRR
jgi:predicted acylesterase/phospholipase RssA